MKRKNKEVGVCPFCGKETTKGYIPNDIKGHGQPGWPGGNKKTFYCGCRGLRVI